MIAEIMELLVNFTGVAKAEYTKLWCGERGEEDICMIEAGKMNRTESLQAVQVRQWILISENF